MSSDTSRNSEEKWFFSLFILTLSCPLLFGVALAPEDVFWFVLICFRLYSKLLPYRFRQWHSSPGSLPCMAQVFCMQVLLVLCGDGWLFHSSPCLLELQWLRSVPLSQFVSLSSDYFNSFSHFYSFMYTYA